MVWWSFHLGWLGWTGGGRGRGGRGGASSRPARRLTTREQPMSSKMPQNPSKCPQRILCLHLKMPFWLPKDGNQSGPGDSPPGNNQRPTDPQTHALNVWSAPKNALLDTQRWYCLVICAIGGGAVRDWRASLAPQIMGLLLKLSVNLQKVLTSKGRPLPLKQKSSTDVRIRLLCFWNLNIKFKQISNSCIWKVYRWLFSIFQTPTMLSLYPYFHFLGLALGTNSMSMVVSSEIDLDLKFLDNSIFHNAIWTSSIQQA